MAFPERVVNFGAGPAMLPLEVLKEAQASLLNYKNSGQSVLELSHRGPEFTEILDDARDTLRRLLNVPANYEILFMHGGGNGQFAAVPLNLLPIGDDKAFGDYIISGTWSQAAHKEALRFSPAKVAIDSNEGGKFKKVPDPSNWKLSADSTYVYYCDNETVNGVEFPSVPSVGNKILVGDMSSNFLSRPVDISKFGIVWAGAQKNCGISGVTLVIVRKDLIQNKGKVRPNILDYNVVADGKSVYNTPDTFAVYIAGLMFHWVERQGGVDALNQTNAMKAELLYNYIDSVPTFYQSIVDKTYRSRMNVVFRVVPNALEAEFVKESSAQGLHGLAGHRSVGGIRASLYNVISLENVKTLVDFMESFRAKHQK